MAKDVGELIEKARKELSKLTGLKASTTIGIVNGDNGWRISVEMVEKESIPDQMDILATYEVSIDEGGNLLGFERKSMRKRGDSAA